MLNGLIYSRASIKSDIEYAIHDILTKYQEKYIGAYELEDCGIISSNSRAIPPTVHKDILRCFKHLVPLHDTFGIGGDS